MANDEQCYSNFYKVTNGIAKIDRLLFNAISKKSQSRQRWTVEVHNISCDHPFKWHNNGQMISVISPHVTQENRFDASEKTSFVVISSATTQRGLISHSIDLSTPTPFFINVWTNSYLELYVCEFDSSNMEHKILRSFNGILHVHIRTAE